MTAGARSGGDRTLRRALVWAAFIGCVLLVPFTAMQFTSEVNWTAFDFIVVAVLLGGFGVAYELAALRGTPYYRGGAAVGLAAAIMLFVATGAVGVIGSEDEPANRIYLGLIALVFLAAVISGFRAAALRWVMYFAAVAQIAIGAVAVAAGWGQDTHIYPWDIIGASAVFAGLWVASGWLFGRAARA